MNRWIIVSNRLPFSYDPKTNLLSQSSGGLVTAIRGIKTQTPKVWIGSVPNSVPKAAISKATKNDPIKYSFPSLDEDLYDRYYNGFCNDVLWPILHYEADLVRYTEERWLDYVRVNQIFAEHILKVTGKNDLIWLHDFHLFLVPKFIKEQRPDAKVGFFLHVPFPSSEIFRQLPCRREIMESLIRSDLIGFHDFSYLRHFASTVYFLLGHKFNLFEITSGDHRTKLGVFPVSINTPSIVKSAKSSATNKLFLQLKKNQGRIKTILGVDRLDYTKGIVHKLKAFQLFLREHPEWIGRVQLTQVAVPSRVEVEDYKNLKLEIEQLVGQINGEFSQLNYIPIRYIFSSISSEALLSLYRSSSVLFVTSKRDGMNLVCLEYVAAQEAKNPGVVLLSEFAGAAAILSHASLINPMNYYATSKSLLEALTMPLTERSQNHQTMLKFLMNYTGTKWAESFMRSLMEKSSHKSQKTKPLNQLNAQKQLFKSLKRKPIHLLLDYDGTLTPIVNNPDKALLTKSMKTLIKRMNKHKDFKISFVTGRPATFFEKNFNDLKVNLACEHGANFFDAETRKWQLLVKSDIKNWYKHALKIMQEFCERTPNSFVEQKQYAIAWHFRRSPSDFSDFLAKKLVEELETTLSHAPVSVILGKKVVEIKAIEANKGHFTQWYREKFMHENASIIAMGDDRTDEDMFRNLNREHTTIKIGSSRSTAAEYAITRQEDVEGFLTYLYEQISKG